jgi:hypothetical protein
MDLRVISLAAASNQVNSRREDKIGAAQIAATSVRSKAWPNEGGERRPKRRSVKAKEKPTALPGTYYYGK